MNYAIVALYILTLLFLYLMQSKQSKAEVLKFREYVRAIKAEDLNDYMVSEPASEDFNTEIPMDDEFMELSEFSPEALLKKLNKK